MAYISEHHLTEWKWKKTNFIVGAKSISKEKKIEKTIAINWNEKNEDGYISMGFYLKCYFNQDFYLRHFA